MSKFIRFVFLLFIAVVAKESTIAQNWDWSVHFGNDGSEIINDLKLMDSGDYFIAGAYGETMEIGDTSLESMGFSDVFLSKLNNSGTAQWAVSGGSLNIDETAGISVGTDGDIVWTGQFWVQGFFGPDTIFAQSSSKALFLVKYGQSGNYHWSKSISGSAIKVVNDVVTDSENSIYLTGYFEDSLFIDATTLIATQGQHFFILKFDASGNLIFGKNYGISGSIRGNTIEIDSNNDVIVGGYFNGTVNFDGFLLESNNLHFGLFLVKFNPTGMAVWAKEALGVFNNICSSVTIDSENNIYLSGSFIGVMILSDNLQIATPGFKENLFLLKYNTSGSPIWARGLNSQEFNEISLGLDIEVHEENISMTGYFDKELKVDEHNIMAASDQFNGFVAAFSTIDGKADWLKLIPGSAQLVSSQIDIDEQGQFSLGGYFSNEAYFGNNTLISNGSNDIFVSKLDVVSTTDPELKASKSGIHIFPNPATDFVNILTESNIFIIKIFDLHGKLLRCIENEKWIDTSGLLPGSYILQFETKSFVENTLLLKI